MTLAVGDDLEEQNVHEELLCEHSDFFTAALKKEWQEGQERRVPLPTDRPEIVDLYVQWLYRAKLFTRPFIEDAGGDCVESTLLVKLFVFGEKVQDGRVRDAAIDALVMAMNTEDKDGKRWFPTGRVGDAYDGTPSGSPLRRLFVDMYVSRGDDTWIEGTEPTEFLADLSRALITSHRDRPNPDPISAEVSTCQYHHHVEDTKCYAASRA